MSNDYITSYSRDGHKIKELPFTHKDTDNLQKLYEEFNYVIYRKKNIGRRGFVSCYKSLGEYKYPSTCRRILLYFSGHGNAAGSLTMQDGWDVKIEDIISCFRVDVANNVRLLEMAKMFFFDACRGSKIDEGYPIPENGKAAADIVRKLPKEGGMVIAYASTPYHKAYGCSDGSRWTNCLVKALKESKRSDDVNYILTKTNILMKNEPNYSVCQTAEFTNNLKDFVHFKQEAVKQ